MIAIRCPEVVRSPVFHSRRMRCARPRPPQASNHSKAKPRRGHARPVGLQRCAAAPAALRGALASGQTSPRVPRLGGSDRREAPAVVTCRFEPLAQPAHGLGLGRRGVVPRRLEEHDVDLLTSNFFVRGTSVASHLFEATDERHLLEVDLLNFGVETRKDQHLTRGRRRAAIERGDISVGCDRGGGQRVHRDKPGSQQESFPGSRQQVSRLG